ncbi:MAG: leucyl/phenylalanyl-tRNA--protein transferase [Thiobacillaceae bacterium]|jgi:leucyl/phenylalanyl-tRNA---protein transferase
MLPWLHPGDPFPAASTALKDPNGLLAAGGDLQPDTLLAAYREGIFPWFGEGQPILWWNPDPRMVLFPSEFKLRRSLAKRLRHGGFEVRLDTCFAQVMAECAAPRVEQDGTWISPAMVGAYSRLHAQGYAHSVESWLGEELVGGLYGVAIGRMFYGESMFSRVADASKIALAVLCRQLQAWGFGLIDCQSYTPHLASLGARKIPREAFIQMLRELVNLPHHPGPWKFEHVSV